MSDWNWLERLLTEQNVGNEEPGLVQSLLRNYNLYALTGHSRLGLALFLLRAGSDVLDALNQEAQRKALKIDKEK